MAGRQRILGGRQQVAVRTLDHAELTQVAADAGLGGLEPFTVQQADELGLSRNGRSPQDADDRIAAQGLGGEVGCQGLSSGTGE